MHLKNVPKLWFAAHLTGIIDMNDSLGQPALLRFHVLPDASEHTQVRMSSLVGCRLSFVDCQRVPNPTHRALIG